MNDVWCDWDDAGHDPLAASDPPVDMEPDTEDEPSISTTWPADIDE